MNKPGNVSMVKIHVEYWIEEFIKSHARTASKEIYGWLVGHETAAGEVLVVSAIACERYETQDEVTARPDPREIQQLGSALPQGIGFVGIYHSHLGQVFHSTTDEDTALKLTRFYPNVISAVTNGTETRWYQHAGGKKFEEFQPNKTLLVGERLKLIKAEAIVDYELLIDPTSKAITQASAALMDGFRASWAAAGIEFCSGQACKLKPPKPSGTWTIADLGNNTLKFQDNADVIARVKMRISTKPEGNRTRILRGTLRLDGIMGFEQGKIDGAIFAERLEAEFLDDLMGKAGRATLSEGRGTDEMSMLVPPVTSFLPYLGVPLKIRLQASGTDAEAAARDREMLHAMIKRAILFFSSKHVPAGTTLLESLRDLLATMNESELLKKCNAGIELARSLDKHDEEKK